MLKFIAKAITHCLYCMAETQAIAKRELFRVSLIGTDPVDVHVSQTSDSKTENEKTCMGHKRNLCE